MILIEKIYDTKSEFKKIYSSIRYYTNQYTQRTTHKESLEFYLTHVIDDYIAYWKRIKMSINTIYKLHRFAISYRHCIVYTLSQPNFYGDLEKMRDFRTLTKDEFLQSYSYLTEKEYDNTLAIEHLITHIQCTR